jgi:pyruvate kinase
MKHPNNTNTTAEVQNTAVIGERKNMNLPGAVVTLPTLTEKVRFPLSHNPKQEKSRVVDLF